MNYRTPEGRAAQIRKVKETLLASRSAILTTHINADGDGAGCEAALSSWLRANGTEAWIINPTPFPETFHFAVEDERWIVPAGSARARDLCDQADLAVVLDTGEVPRIGRTRDLIRKLRTVVIDHHQPGVQPIGGISLCDPAAAATGELIYDLVLAADGPWTEYVALGIYVAVLTDTGSFRFSNTTPGTHMMAADLISRGVDSEDVYSRIYGRARLRKYQLLGAALETLENDEEYGIAWMTVPTDAYEALGATAEDLEGMVDIPRSIIGNKVALLFSKATTGGIKISFRSSGRFNVNQLAHQFGGGGHVKASGAMVEGPLERALEKVLMAAREMIARDSAEVLEKDT